MPSLGAAEVIRRPEVATCVETVPEVIQVCDIVGHFNDSLFGTLETS